MLTMPTSLLAPTLSGAGKRPDDAVAGWLVQSLASFGVVGEIVGMTIGPRLVTYEFRPAAGIRAAKVGTLAEDLAVAIAAEFVRVQPYPERSALSIEVPRSDGGDTVGLREILDSDVFQTAPSPLALALGRDTRGDPVTSDLGSMPHLLIGGTTGSGKSVCIHTIIMSLLFKVPPARLRLVLVDPKAVELGVYAKIPQLLAPIATEPAQIRDTLNQTVAEMERRYRLFSTIEGVRSLEEYNRSVATNGSAPLPFIVLVIDELADLFRFFPKEAEAQVIRIARMSRAAGIHIVAATQRPSSDVVTSNLKANLPGRIAFRVVSRTESRIILDSGGAESLLGTGDMLLLDPQATAIQRVQGAYVSDTEKRVVARYLEVSGLRRPNPHEPAPETHPGNATEPRNAEMGAEDPLLPEAIAFATREGCASIPLFQKHLGVGFHRAAMLLSTLERRGMLDPPSHGQPRRVISPERRR